MKGMRCYIPKSLIARPLSGRLMYIVLCCACWPIYSLALNLFVPAPDIAAVGTILTSYVAMTFCLAEIRAHHLPEN